MNYLIYFVLLCILFMHLPKNSNAQDEINDFFEPKTSIGGYGELHYNYHKAEKGYSNKTLDFHRFVVYIGHAWTEEWSFRSEIELEHNLVKNGQGSLQLEQAFLNYNYASYLSLQAGVLLVASSLINEYHEPVFFLSVERPEYAKYIIPTTWFGNGIGASGFYSGFDYRFVILEGLDGSQISPSLGIRDTRQKGYKASAKELLYNLRIDYIDIPGFRFGGSFSTNNSVVTDSTNNMINIWEIHVRYQSNGIYSMFEYGNISYKSGELKGSHGYYLDLGYNIGYPLNWGIKMIPWIRWTEYNIAAETSIGGNIEETYHYKKWLIGLALFPIQNVVLKADYGIRERQSDGKKIRLFNLGFGYNF